MDVMGQAPESAHSCGWNGKRFRWSRTSNQSKSWLVLGWRKAATSFWRLATQRRLGLARGLLRRDRLHDRSAIAWHARSRARRSHAEAAAPRSKCLSCPRNSVSSEAVTPDTLSDKVTFWTLSGS